MYQPIDLTEVEAGYIEDAGQHVVQIVSVENTESKSGNPGYKFSYRNAKGEAHTDTNWLSTAALWRLSALANAAQLSEAERKQFTPDMLIGKTLIINLENDKDNPQYLKLIGYGKYSEGGAAAVPPVAQKAKANSNDLPF